MKFAESPLRPRLLGQGQFSRSLAIQVRAAARQSPSKTSKNGSISREERIVETVEVAALTAAAAAAGLAFSRSRSHAPVAKDQTPQRRTAAVTGTGSLPPAAETNLEALWITGPIFIAVAARSIAARLARRRVEATPAAQAMSRLAAAETALTKQAESLSILMRQVDKVQIRTRLVSRDMRDQVKDLQALTENHSEALLGAGAKVAQVESQLRGLEELVDAVQGVAAKQFSLLSSVIGQQKKGSPVGNTAAAKKSKSNFDKNRNSSVAAAVKREPPLAAAQQQQREEIPKSGKDEWGRDVTESQYLQNKKDEEDKEEEAKERTSSGGAGVEAVAAAAADSLDGERQMKINEDGSVSFSF